MTPERIEKLSRVLRKRQFDLTVVLENVFDPHNISAVMRTCDAVGIQEIHILNTRIPRHKKWGARSSSSAAKWLTVHQYEDLATCFERLRKQYDKILTTHLSGSAVSLYDLDLTGSVALVFGNEHSGVSEEIRKWGDGDFLIPQAGIIQSLNISVACAVTVYEAYRQKERAGHYDRSEGFNTAAEQVRSDWGLPAL
ncbi:MAG: RNA methyltransferase [Sphingomonadales bacterium]|nr:RNA methyltransferase [Sphingomonadales bacterium]